jgi:hypothetical protein
MTIEIAVKISNAERSLTEKHMAYDTDQIVLDKKDLTLKRVVEQATKNFGEEPEDCVLKFKMVW